MRAVCLVASAAFFMLTSPAWGQQIPCADREVAVKHLAQKYQESQIAYGLTNRGHMMELFISKDGETWTLVVSQPNGLSCMIVAGQGWHPVEPKPVGPET